MRKNDSQVLELKEDDKILVVTPSKNKNIETAFDISNKHGLIGGWDSEQQNFVILHGADEDMRHALQEIIKTGFNAEIHNAKDCLAAPSTPEENPKETEDNIPLLVIPTQGLDDKAIETIDQVAQNYELDSAIHNAEGFIIYRSRDDSLKAIEQAETHLSQDGHNAFCVLRHELNDIDIDLSPSQDFADDMLQELGISAEGSCLVVKPYSQADYTEIQQNPDQYEQIVAEKYDEILNNGKLEEFQTDVDQLTSKLGLNAVKISADQILIHGDEAALEQIEFNFKDNNYSFTKMSGAEAIELGYGLEQDIDALDDDVIQLDPEADSVLAYFLAPKNDVENAKEHGWGTDFIIERVGANLQQLQLTSETALEQFYEFARKHQLAHIDDDNTCFYLAGPKSNVEAAQKDIPVHFSGFIISVEAFNALELEYESDPLDQLAQTFDNATGLNKEPEDTSEANFIYDEKKHGVIGIYPFNQQQLDSAFLSPAKAEVMKAFFNAVISEIDDLRDYCNEIITKHNLLSLTSAEQGIFLTGNIDDILKAEKDIRENGRFGVKFMDFDPEGGFKEKAIQKARSYTRVLN